MKVFAVLLIAFCAVSFVAAANTWRTETSNEQDSDYDQEEQRMPWQSQSGGQRKKSSSARQQQSPQDSQMALTNTNEPLPTVWVDVLPYRMKINQRLDTSLGLIDQPKAKEKLMKFMEDKLNMCKSNGIGKYIVDKNCIGRLTGQMMQMIAAFENGARDMPGYEW